MMYYEKSYYIHLLNIECLVDVCNKKRKDAAIWKRIYFERVKSDLLYKSRDHRKHNKLILLIYIIETT